MPQSIVSLGRPPCSFLFGRDVAAAGVDETRLRGSDPGNPAKTTVLVTDAIFIARQWRGQAWTSAP